MKPSSALRVRTAPQIGHTPLAMVEVAGPEHHVCFVNDAFCRLLGEERKTLLGRPFAEIVANGRSCSALLDRVYETGRFEAHPASEAPGVDAGSFWLYALWPSLDAEARPVGVIIQLTRSKEDRRDVAAMNEALLIGALRQHELREASEAANVRLQSEVAERLSVEHALQKAQAGLRAEAERLESTVAERTAQLRASVAQLEAFAYSLAHDLRAPVRAIQGFVQLTLELPGAETHPGAELLRRVVTAAERMETLIQDVLSLNRVASQPIELASIDVDALVHTLLAERPELGPDRADISIEGLLPPMFGHEATFSQCLTNLLGNAVKFVRPGARPSVRIWAEERELPAEATEAHRASGNLATQPKGRSVVRLWVEDDGIGIAPEHRAKVFEIFQRLHPASRYEGTGIGLAIVHKAIHRMGGQVGLEPGGSQGSRFWLELPRG